MPLSAIFPTRVLLDLFRLESSILTRAKRATNRNNVATEKREGGRGSIPRTVNTTQMGIITREGRFTRNKLSSKIYN